MKQNLVSFFLQKYWLMYLISGADYRVSSAIPFSGLNYSLKIKVCNKVLILTDHDLLSLTNMQNLVAVGESTTEFYQT